jgi:hypothetical protein
MSLYQLVCNAHILSNELTKNIYNQLESIFIDILLPNIKDKIIANALIGKNYANINEYITLYPISKFDVLDEYKNNNKNNKIYFNIPNKFNNINNIINFICEIFVPDAIKDFLIKNIEKEFTIKNCKIIKIIDKYGFFTNTINIIFDIEWEKPLV